MHAAVRSVKIACAQGAKGAVGVELQYVQESHVERVEFDGYALFYAPFFCAMGKKSTL